MENPGRVWDLSGETDQVVPVLDGYSEKSAEMNRKHTLQYNGAAVNIHAWTH
jgi:hypothetical protein